MQIASVRPFGCAQGRPELVEGRLAGSTGSRVLCTLILCLVAVAAAHAQPATLAGTVKSSDGAPIAGARVTVMSAQKPSVGVADTNGKFSIPDVVLPADIEVTARGFEASRRTVTVTTVEITLAPAVVTQSVVVTPDREASFRDPSTGTTVLSRSDLDQLPVVTTDEALRVVSGFSLFRRSSARASNPTTHGVTMRGLSASGSSRGLVLLDGVPLNDGFGGWVTWTRVPPDAISRIDVDRGAEGEAVGTDALGGLIRIVTPAAGNTTFQIGGEGGTPGVGGLDFAIAGRIGRAAGFGSGSWYHTDGVIPVAPESRGPVDQPANATWSNLYGRVVFGQGSRRLTAVGWGGSDDRGNGTVIQVNRMSGGTGAVAYEATSGQMTFAGRLSVSPNRFYQTFSTVNAARTSEVLTSAQTTDGTTTRGVVEVGRGIGRGQILASYQFSHAGVDFEDARPTVTTTQALRDDSQAIALQGGCGAGGAAVGLAAACGTSGARRPRARTRDDQATVGRANAAFELTRTTFLRGSVASSHRWPTLNELVRNFQAGNVLTRANPNLRPERARSADVGIGTSGAKWQAVGGRVLDRRARCDRERHDLDRRAHHARAPQRRRRARARSRARWGSAADAASCGCVSRARSPTRGSVIRSSRRSKATGCRRCRRRRARPRSIGCCRTAS